MKKTSLFLLVGLIVGTSGTWVYFSNQLKNHSAPYNAEEVLDEGDEEDIELKIEEANQPYFDGNMEEQFGDCEANKEMEALQKRFACNKKRDKSPKYWASMSEAEKVVMQLLLTKKQVSFTGILAAILMI